MARQDSADVPSPSLFLLLSELRVGAEMAQYFLRGLGERRLPRGHGEPVMVIPGFGASDANTAALRTALTRLGYEAVGWGCGRNMGMRAQVRDRLSQSLRSLHQERGRKVTLIGWSLGGVFAREMARHQPQLVRRVFTLGSPFNGHPNANNLVKLFALLNPKMRGAPDMDGFRRRIPAPPVPCTAIHTKSDGIVAWQCSVETEGAQIENVEVRGSHFGLPLNPQVLKVIAERMAKDAG
ncbi:alpha/beta fold hydrolase [Solimonas sp. K1W22B-7]|uniref:alpha/beta fold hydrolase n=1 Tax=Solimonas sp. K1W22B-7 TaxID=2303331 RepID=UPI000E333CFE|nr:alpha/beta fold hydrolase [Solimonas sp. K1W22B-7]AXQ30979.1 alpha/beta fold hydrolase [Solimonas sp. K1W22B-7]